MTNSILITGCAGSGKSSLARYLAEQGHNALDIETLDGLYQVIDSETGLPSSGNDNNSAASADRYLWECSPEKLQALIKKNSSTTTFYCGTASNLFEIIPQFDKVLFIQPSKQALRQRLSNRKPGEFGNSPDGQDWIIDRKDDWEARLIAAGAEPITTDGSTEEIAKILLNDFASQP